MNLKNEKEETRHLDRATLILFISRLNLKFDRSDSKLMLPLVNLLSFTFFFIIFFFFFWGTINPFK